MMETKSVGCIAQADVHKFYDEVDLLLMNHKLATYARIPEPLIAAAIRLHVDPYIILHLHDHSFPVGRRAKGLHTGCQTAAVLGRVPIEEVAYARAHIWLHHKFDISPFHGPCFANWCDNVFAFGDSQEDAVAFLEDLQLHLQLHWGLRISDNSKAILTPRHSLEVPECLVERGRSKPTIFKALGRFYSDNGNTEEAWQLLKPCLWRAFWSNFGRKELRCSPRLKISLLRRTVEPILRFHYVNGWPLSKTRARQVDSLQSAMVAKFIRLPPTLVETASEYFNRRSMHAARLIGQENR